MKQVIVNHLRVKETEVYTAGMKTASLRRSVLNGRKHCFLWTELAESPQNHLGSFLADVNADVRVQHIPGFHHGPLRFCGLSFSRSAAVRSKSSGKSANRSNARTVVPSFSRKMISSPRRKISTSSLFNLNCFGSRAAWPFPDLNSPYIPEVCTAPHEIAKRPASPVSERTAAQEGLAVPNTRYFCCKDQGFVNPPSA